MSEAVLQRYEDSGELPKKRDIAWRAAGDEIHPKPREGEVVVLLDHVTRGLRPPGSTFFRRVLAYYGLTPLDLAPNSILNISNFVVYCEDYLQVEPNLALFLETFYCNPQNRKNHAMGPYGGVAIQRRRSAVAYYPALELASHPKGWHNTYFYCKDTSVARDIAKYPGFRRTPLEWNACMNSFAKEGQARMEIQALTRRGKALIAHGLTGVDLVKCWIRWSIQPLAIRPRLIFEYTGEATDTLRYSEAPILEEQVVKNAKPLLGEKLDKIALNGLAPFYAQHQAPPMVTS